MSTIDNKRGVESEKVYRGVIIMRTEIARKECEKKEND